MSNINKQALRDKIQLKREILDTQTVIDIDELEALLDELEAAQSYAKERDEENQDLMLTVGRLRVERETSEAEMGNALCQLLPGCQYMDPPDGGSVTPLEQVRRMVADYRERIAELELRLSQQQSIAANNLDMFRRADARVSELEAREVVLPQRLSMEGGAYCTAHARYDEEGDYFDRDEVIEAIRAAGIITKVGE